MNLGVPLEVAQDQSGPFVMLNAEGLALDQAALQRLEVSFIYHCNRLQSRRINK